MSLVIVLRLVHIVLGALWVGMMAFNTFFLGPALRDVGKAGAPIMGALQRRRLMTIMPIFAVLTILSGGWLLGMMYGGRMDSAAGMTFSTGGTAAIIAFLIGITTVRPAMMRAATLAQDPNADQALLQRLRARATVAGNVVTGLLLLATVAMAVARYL